jgi:hypothetical protein
MAAPRNRTKQLIYFSACFSKPFIKDHECILKLQQINVFLEKRSTSSTNTISVGWLAYIHPLMTWKDQLLDEVSSAIRSIINTTITGLDVIQRPRRFGNEFRVETAAYDIECDRDQEEQLLLALCNPKFQELTGAVYVPARLLQNSGEDPYRDFLAAHTEYCRTLGSTVIHGLKPTLLEMGVPSVSRPVYDMIADRSKDIRIHQTMTSLENGRYLVSYPESIQDEVTQRIKDALHSIGNMSFSPNDRLLFNGRLPSLQAAPRQFQSPALTAYAKSVCASVRSTKHDFNGTPTVITLQRNYRSQGPRPSSYQAALTNDNASQQSLVTTATATETQATSQSDISKLTNDVSVMQGTIASLSSTLHGLQSTINTQQTTWQGLQTTINTQQTTWQENMDTRMAATFNQFQATMVHTMETSMQAILLRNFPPAPTQQHPQQHAINPSLASASGPPTASEGDDPMTEAGP